MLENLKILIYQTLKDDNRNPTARLFPQTDYIKGVYTFGVRRYNAAENRVDVEVFCNNDYPEGTDEMADEAINLMEAEGFYLTGIRDSSDSQKGIYRQDLTFALLTHNGYERLKLGYKTTVGDTVGSINGIMGMSMVAQKKEVYRKQGRFEVGPLVTEEILKRRGDDGLIRLTGKALMDDYGQTKLRENYAAQAVFWLVVGDGTYQRQVKATVQEIKPTIAGFEAGIKLLGGFV